MTKKLIPFDYELYKKGYKAVMRDGTEVLAIFEEKDNRLGDYAYVYKDEYGQNELELVYKNGLYDDDEKNPYDIFLEAKTIDLYIGLIDKSNDKVFTTFAYLDKESLKINHGNNINIVKITVDAETLEQVE